MSSGSEPASPRKLGRARAVGDVPNFLPFSQGLVLCAIALVAPAWAKALGDSTTDRLRFSLLNHDGALSTLKAALDSSLHAIIAYSVPILAVAATASLTARVLESRAAAASSATTPASARDGGFRVRSLVSLNSVLCTMAAWTLAAGLAAGTWWWFRFNIASIVGTLGSVHAGAELTKSTAMKWLGLAGIAWALVGVLGFSLAHRLWLWQKRMTRYEKQLEHKELQGDPLILDARRKVLRELAAEASLRIEQASVIVLDSGRAAAILHYDTVAAEAPRLIGIARGASLAGVLTLARQHDIPVVEDSSLANLLVKGSVGVAISESLFEAVAQLLANVLTPDSKRPA